MQEHDLDAVAGAKHPGERSATPPAGPDRSLAGVLAVVVLLAAALGVAPPLWAFLKSQAARAEVVKQADRREGLWKELASLEVAAAPAGGGAPSPAVGVRVVDEWRRDRLGWASRLLDMLAAKPPGWNSERFQIVSDWRFDAPAAGMEPVPHRWFRLTLDGRVPGTGSVAAVHRWMNQTRESDIWRSNVDEMTLRTEPPARDGSVRVQIKARLDMGQGASDAP
jgi:hypothetical protein